MAYTAQQPGYGQPQQQHTVVVVQPSATSASNGQPQNIREWSSGLCGCCDDIATCAVAVCFPPCYMCWLASDMNENPCGACICGSVFAVPMRTKIRTMYGIRGDICHDACCVLFCPQLALTQVHRELKRNGYAR